MRNMFNIFHRKKKNPLIYYNIPYFKPMPCEECQGRGGCSACAWLLSQK